MANDSGAGAKELQEALDAAEAAGDEELVRYYKRVQADRNQRKAIIESRDLVLGNKDHYADETVRQQEDLAEDRPTEPVKFEDVNLRGTDVVVSDEAPAEDKPSRKSGK